MSLTLEAASPAATLRKWNDRMHEAGFRLGHSYDD